MATKRPFPINPILTAIAMGYTNGEMIADFVAPRVLVGAEAFKYTVHRLEHFDPEDDTVGRAGRVPEVKFGVDQSDGSVADHGLESAIPQSDIDAATQQGGNYDPVANASLKLAKKIVLNRELRVAAIAFAAASYPTGNKVQLTGNDQWNSGHADADPVADIMAAIDSMMIRPNMIVVGHSTFSVLRQSSAVSQAIGGASTAGRIVSRQAIADLFEVQSIQVGDSWSNSANKGQTASQGRIWGKHMALLHVDPNPTDMDEITFMATAEHGTREASDWFDKNIGLRGGTRVRVGETVREIVLASDVGYFIEDAVA